MLAALLVAACTLDVVFSAITDIDLNGFISGSVGYKMIGPTAAANFGSHGQPAGDFNGDGYEDVVTSAAGPAVAYVVFGRLGNVASTIDMASFTTSTTSGFKITGVTGGDGFGEYVDGAGDMNGDGYDDVIFGAHWTTYSGRTQAGAAYVLFGHPNSQVT